MIIDVLKNKVSLKANRKMTRHREEIHGSMKLNTLRKNQNTEHNEKSMLGGQLVLANSPAHWNNGSSYPTHLEVEIATLDDMNNLSQIEKVLEKVCTE